MNGLYLVRFARKSRGPSYVRFPVRFPGKKKMEKGVRPINARASETRIQIGDLSRRWLSRAAGARSRSEPRV